MIFKNDSTKSDGNGALLLFLFDRHFRPSSSIFSLEIIFPILPIFYQIVIEGKLRVHSFEGVSQMVDIFIWPSRPKSRIDFFEVLMKKLLSLDGIVDFEDFDSFKHGCWFDFIGFRGEDWREEDLEIATDGDEGSVCVVHVGLGDGLEGVQIFLADLYLVIIDILVLFEHVVKDIVVIEGWIVGLKLPVVFWRFHWGYLRRGLLRITVFLPPLGFTHAKIYYSIADSYSHINSKKVNKMQIDLFVE